jgi:protein TonB
MLAVVWRGESLPALVVDLREDLVSSAASVRTLVREALPARVTSAAAGASTPRQGGVVAAPPAQPIASPPASAPAQPVVSPLADGARPAPEPDRTPPAPEPAAPALVPVPAPRGPSPVTVAELPSSVPLPSPVPPPPAPSGEGRGERLLPSPPPAGASVVAAASQPSSAGASGARVASAGAPGPSTNGAAGPPASRPAVARATPGAGSGVGAEYGPYLTALRQRIQQSLRYPASARRRGVSGTVSVEILIQANGSIGDVTLIDSSRHAVLDEAAMETIRSLPRMPLPPELPARPLRIRVPVVFEMREP